eukprot:43117-Chlamydomonas_euryale.AAC.1
MRKLRRGRWRRGRARLRRGAAQQGALVASQPVPAGQPAASTCWSICGWVWGVERLTAGVGTQLHGCSQYPLVNLQAGVGCECLVARGGSGTVCLHGVTFPVA